MRPCDCKSIEEATNNLTEQGLRFNDEAIHIMPQLVILTFGSVEIKMSMSRFKSFAEWYLEDQEI